MDITDDICDLGVELHDHTWVWSTHLYGYPPGRSYPAWEWNAACHMPPALIIHLPHLYTLGERN